MLHASLFNTHVFLTCLYLLLHKNEDNERLIEEIRSRDKELDELIEQVNERDGLIRKKEMRLMRISQVRCFILDCAHVVFNHLMH